MGPKFMTLQVDADPEETVSMTWSVVTAINHSRGEA